MRHLSCLFILVLFVLMSFCIPCNASWSSRNPAKLDDLQIKAAGSGTVRVIVKLDVPRIDELLSQSHAFHTVEPGRKKDWGGTNADRALAAAISASAEFVKFALGKASFKVHHIYKSIPYMALEVSPEALAAIDLMPEVVSIEEDVPVPLPDPEEPAVPADLDAPMLNNTVNITGASNSWNMGYTGSGWYVAILDTGIRKTHEMFAGKTIVEACYALGQDGIGPAGDCPNGQISMNSPGAAVHYASSYSGYDHGTHVSGIAAGHSASLSGMAKDANIIAVQVFSKFAASYRPCNRVPCILSYTSDQVAGLDYVYSIRGSYSIAAVNMSLGGSQYYSPCDSTETASKASIDNLRTVGIATAIATGNNGYCGSISAPACISSSVAVGASDDSDVEAYFNNWHPTMQKLFAPGVSIYSSTADSDTSYESWSGTSMATPHVTGAWALIKQAVPSGSVTDILSALQSTGVTIATTCSSPSGSVPRIRVDAAINALIPTSTSSTTTTIAASSTTTIGSSSTTTIVVSSTTTIGASSTTTTGVSSTTTIDASSTTTTIGLSSTTTTGVSSTTTIDASSTTSTIGLSTTTTIGVSSTTTIGASSTTTAAVSSSTTTSEAPATTTSLPDITTTTSIEPASSTTTVAVTTTAVSPIDSDGDGIPDAQDNCPTKPNGPNLGTCSSTSDKPGGNCTSDADCANGCSSNGLCIKDQRDSDGDGVGDVCDCAPLDNTKFKIWTVYTDADGDGHGAGIAVEICGGATVPAGYSTSNDDGCPNDPLKIAPGMCGCGVPDTDSDHDGVLDCIDNCPNIPNGPLLGTCMPGSDKAGATCHSDADCVNGCSTNGKCSLNQEDTNGDGKGDVCSP